MIDQQQKGSIRIDIFDDSFLRPLLLLELLNKVISSSTII